METQEPCTYSNKRSGCGVKIMLLLLGFALFISVALNIGLGVGLFVSGKHLSSKDEGGSDEYPGLTETWSFGDGDVKAARIAIDGVIMRESEGGLFGPGPDKIESIMRQIRTADNDEDVMAIILEVDSPGGGVTASDEIYDALLRFKENAEGRKIVVFMRELAASGGYYVAMAGDWLIAEPTSIIGSIGVIMQSLNFKDLSAKIGIKDVTIKSGANKDLLNPFSEVPPEQLALLQTLIDSTYSRFYDIVQENRQLEESALRPLADGRIFDAPFALDAGLIDEIGYWQEAIAKTAELLGTNTVKVVRYDEQPDFFDVFRNMQTPNPLRAITTMDRSRLMYLWKP